MRKSFLTKEYSLEPISGTMNQKEIRNFFISKIMEIEDEILVDKTDIYWTESNDQTQGIKLEDMNKAFNSSVVKQINHSITVLPNQKEFISWRIDINIREIIKQYLFSQIKLNRTFEGILNSNTYYNSVDLAIMQYIEQNIFPRIKFFNLNFFVFFSKIGSVDETGNIALQYDNKFNQGILDYASKVTNFKLTTDVSENIASLIYKQTENSLDYKFDYYFDVIWKKA